MRSKETINKWRTTLLKRYGAVAWNKGLTKEKDKRVEKYGLSHRGWSPSIHTREKMSNSKKGKPSWNKGIRWATDHRLKLSDVHKGKKLSVSHKNNISKSLKGKPKTREHNHKVSLALKGRNLSNDHREKIRKKMITISNSPSNIKKFKERMSHIIIPKQDSSIELKIQKLLNILGIFYVPHKYMEIDNAYHCDIYIPTMNLIIECDGDYWHGNTEIFGADELTDKQKNQKRRDKLRTKQLNAKGYKVMRIWENEINRMEVIDLKHKLRQLNTKMA
jgi:very-short-patch-repair endonuclease